MSHITTPSGVTVSFTLVELEALWQYLTHSELEDGVRMGQDANAGLVSARYKVRSAIAVCGLVDADDEDGAEDP